MSIYRVRVDERYSALLTFRWLRRCGLSVRDAYWEAIVRHGWPAPAHYAEAILKARKADALGKETR